MRSRRAGVVSVCALVLAAFIVVLAMSSRHATDASLIANFKSHEAEFHNLAAMAVQDSHVVMVKDSVVSLFQEGTPTSYVYIYKGKKWPASEAELNFSQSRWKDYLDAFAALGLKGGMDRNRTLPDAVFFVASVKIAELDNDETAIVEKGYAYVRGTPLDNVKENLDNIKVDRPAILYRKIQDRWYLYYQWSVSKPE
jgi:hypothetical protein